jgi:hypothetical protein
MPVSKLAARLLNLPLCVVIAAAASISPAWAQMDPRVSELLLRLETQERQIRDLERRLRDLEPTRQQGASTFAPAQALAEGLSGPDLDRLRGRGTEPASAASAQTPAAPVQQAPASSAPRPPAAAQQSQAVGQQAPADAPKQGSSDLRQLAQQPAIFERKLTMEIGTNYARFDRRQLALSGFYALDAIFLGTLSLDQLKGSTFTHDLTMRYGLLESLSMDVQVPWVIRSNRYLSGGAGNNPSQIIEASLNTQGVGDMSMGLSWQLGREVRGTADVVGSLRIKLPTGEHPFGIPNQQIPEPDGKLSTLKIPTRLPTGSGLISISTGLSVLKTFDPVVLYSNIGLTVSAPRHFDDISSGSGQPGSIRLGRTLSLGGGMVLALNDTTAYSMGVSLQASKSTQTQVDGGSWVSVPGSSGNAAVLTLGITQSLGASSSMVTSLGIGLTSDAPNYTLSLRFPFRL